MARTPGVHNETIRAQYLAALRKGFSVKAAAAAAGTTAVSVAEWAKRDPEFAAADKEARDASVGALEKWIDELVLFGRRKLVLHQGRPVLDPRKIAVDPLDPDPWLYEEIIFPEVALKLLAKRAPKQWCPQTRAAWLVRQWDRKSDGGGDDLNPELADMLDRAAANKQATDNGEAAEA